MDLARLLTPPGEGFLDVPPAAPPPPPHPHPPFPDPLGAGMRRWMGVNGLTEHSGEVARFYPPIPPESLRHTACGGLTPESHLYTGVEDFRAVAELFEVFAGRPIESVASVYDFGCGCGRLLRWFAVGLPEARLVGSDVRAASVAWCAANLPGRYLANAVQPPLELETDSLDLVVSLSTFSHFNRASNLAWIEELARVCKPDGLMLLTTHGAFALALISRSPEHQESLHMTQGEAVDYLRRLRRERFLFQAVPGELVEKLDGPEPDYGQAFFDERFVEESWAPFVEPLGCVPVGLSLFQDFHALRPRS